MKYLYIIGLLIIITACEETVLIEVDQTEERFIIEALVTNQPDKQVVRISRTVDFYAEGISPAVSGAQVSVSSSNGTEHGYVEIDTIPGVYVPVQPFVGEVGLTYDLNVQVGERAFTASEELLPVTTVDSLTYEIDEERLAERGPNAFVYDVLLYTKEPQDEENFYLFKFYRNGEELNDNGEDIAVTDDVAVGEAIEGLELPEHHSLGDSVSIEMYSLTRTQFI